MNLRKKNLQKDVRSIHNLSDYIPNKLGFSQKENKFFIIDDEIDTDLRQYIRPIKGKEEACEFSMPAV